MLNELAPVPPAIPVTETFPPEEDIIEKLGLVPLVTATPTLPVPIEFAPPVPLTVTVPLPPAIIFPDCDTLTPTARPPVPLPAEPLTTMLPPFDKMLEKLGLVPPVINTPWLLLPDVDPPVPVIFTFPLAPALIIPPPLT